MKLFAPADYWDILPTVRRKIVNGCGPAGWKGKYVPDHLLFLSITDACDIHDFMYWAGHTEADREEADRVFKNNMLRIIEAKSSNWLTRKIRRMLAHLYYSAVRDNGSIYFWNDKNPAETFRDPVEVFA